MGDRLTGTLSETDLQMLAFERQTWQHQGAKDNAVRDLFGMSATRYAQAVNALIDRPEAYVAEPVLVKRLRRLRDSRRAARSRR